MDKTSNSSSSTENTTTRDQYLKHLNKLSHKISKPVVVTRKPNFDPPPVAAPPLPNSQNAPLQGLQSSASQPHQPPVYNINKNDFRDVVQKLTGSPAHTDRFATPPPIHPPKTQSSRLQRIRPPPLAQLATRPPPLLDGAVSAQPTNPANNTNANHSNNNALIPPMGTAAAHFGGVIGRSTAPLSPLPPFPTIHGAAESPVSAYMRYLHNSLSTGDSGQNMNQKQQHFSGFSPLAPLVSPRWTSLTPPPEQSQNNQNENQNSNQQLAPPDQGMAPPSEAPQPPPPAAASSQLQFAMPPSPLPFGCLNSPRSQYGLLSPTQLGFPQLPLSPTVPAPSPRWRGF